MTDFTRGFRLHLRGGQVLDGAAFPSGRCLVLDDPYFGLSSVAASEEDLLRGYADARIEWPDTIRAEALREAADLADNNGCDGCDGCDSCALRKFAAELRGKADALERPPASPAVPPQHIGNGANAEDCPACSGTNPPYPFVCPGPTAEETP
jgi:hypothetical protein